MNVGYATEQQRLEARRRSWRESKARRYEHYKALCDEAGVSTRRNWQSHYKDLRPAVLPYEEENRVLIRRERNHYRRWWLERFSLAAIREMGAAIDTLAVEDEGRWEMVA